jgi:hypothetical protein
MSGAGNLACSLFEKLMEVVKVSDQDMKTLVERGSIYEAFSQGPRLREFTYYIHPLFLPCVIRKERGKEALLKLRVYEVEDKDHIEDIRRIIKKSKFV